MDMIVNDLSFEGQFHEFDDFHSAISRLMKIRAAATSFGKTLYCHRNLLNAEIMPNITMPRAIQAFSLSERRVLMQWITQQGPFWEDKRSHGESDYIALDDGSIVTDTAIGEAAFCKLNGIERGLVSIVPSSWDYSPILAEWHIDDTVSERTEITNFWALEQLTNELEAAPIKLSTWQELADACINRFSLINFTETSFAHLRGIPFNPSTAERIMSRMKILNELRSCFDTNGNRTEKGFEIINQHFSKDDARFSDSSDSEKAQFRRQLTFNHPSESNVFLFCSWHGKVNGTPPMRIHFSWPMRADEPFYVVYVGAKITRR